ncbi:MAG TPA: hypothetical protein VK105_20290 [Virgibacillus sp.]|nr:hypothetical protein [Virgibacillus sp.]HLR69433.1 hypothetical protein [Virgibacillus sp.]
MKAECDYCGKPSEMKPKIKRSKDTIKKHYFQCDHCKHVYVIGYTNKDIDQERKRLRKLQSKNAPIERIEQKQKLIESKMNNLRIQIES